MASPGLKIVAPSTPYDAKGLIKAAIREDDPVIVFEDGTLWTSTGEVPDGDYVVPLGQADVKREGSNVTVVAISGAVQAALAAADRLAADGVSVEVVDPRSLVPLDYATILASVEKTGHLVVADPSHRTCSLRRRDRGHGGRRRVLVAAGADNPGHRAGHAHPVQPAARAAALPEC